MDITLEEAKERFAEMIQTVQTGETVVITRDGQPVAHLTFPLPRRQVRFGTMRGQIHLKPGWDRPITEDEFLSGDF